MFGLKITETKQKVFVSPRENGQLPSSICTKGKARNLNPYALNKHSFPRAELNK
jgi:hypothetical protein